MRHLIRHKAYLNGEKPLRLHEARSGEDVQPLYDYLAQLNSQYGRKKVLSGDGTV